MNDIINKVASLGGTISTTDISHLSEYKQVLRAKERGDLIRLRHGVYAAPEALLNTMIDVERIIPNGVYAWTMPGHIINCLRQSRLLLHSHCQ
ncbi:MAG: type IV toxin-antitoxin system AbiEi family antitoxin domain-containing protein [Parabacteroides merdae]